MVKNKINCYNYKKKSEFLILFLGINPVERDENQQNRDNSASRTR